MLVESSPASESRESNSHNFSTTKSRSETWPKTYVFPPRRIVNTMASSLPPLFAFIADFSMQFTSFRGKTRLTRPGTWLEKQAKLQLRYRVPNLYFLLKGVKRKHSTLPSNFSPTGRQKRTLYASESFRASKSLFRKEDFFGTFLLRFNNKSMSW